MTKSQHPIATIRAANAGHPLYRGPQHTSPQQPIQSAADTFEVLQTAKDAMNAAAAAHDALTRTGTPDEIAEAYRTYAARCNEFDAAYLADLAAGRVRREAEEDAEAERIDMAAKAARLRELTAHVDEIAAAPTLEAAGWTPEAPAQPPAADPGTEHYVTHAEVDALNSELTDIATEWGTSLTLTPVNELDLLDLIDELRAAVEADDWIGTAALALMVARKAG